MRKFNFVGGEFYHVYNRGNRKAPIFFNEKDFSRFLCTILFFQSRSSIPNFSRLARKFTQSQLAEIDSFPVQSVVEARIVELIAFALMPNHFHLLVKAHSDDGISRYMQRVLNGFTKYSNIKNEESGHLLQGTFGATHVEDNDQLLYLSTYIHRNPREIPAWQKREHLYPWSSYQDYIDKNRWGSLLSPDIVLSQFPPPSAKKYRQFCERSVAKARKTLGTNLPF